MIATVTQDEYVLIRSEKKEGEGSTRIRVLTLSLNGVSVQLSSLGASILRVLVPSRLGGCDDVVMGYKSLQHMWDTRNPAYLNVIVGRVANRIRSGNLVIDGNSYELDRNDGPNHLHGGLDGFSRRIWEAAVIYDNDGRPSVQFSLASDSGDQKYPGAIQTTATYALLPTATNRFGARLCLRLEARLLGDIPTPVNLSQHSYFNLYRHDSPSGCLDHRLAVFSDEYTPVDEASIPTREVRKLANDRVMDFSSPRLLKDALSEYAVAKAGRSTEEARYAVESSARIAPDTNTVGPSSPRSGTPYGFDHNYLIRNSFASGCSDDLPVVAVLEHAASGRRLTVLSDAPGVQLYTANYLDGVSLPPEVCKDAAVYAQWQGICLETQVCVCRRVMCWHTLSSRDGLSCFRGSHECLNSRFRFQHFPDSVDADENAFPDFAKGRCVVLRPSQPSYTQNVEYSFDYDAVPTDVEQKSLQGRDSCDDERFESVEAMWRAQGVGTEDALVTGRSSWYNRTAAFYEDNCESDVDGVLGGFASLSSLDLRGSLSFLSALEHLQSTSFSWSLGSACECGAGIGRVTKGLLLSLGFQRWDLVESSSRLISAAPEYIGDADSGRCRFFCAGLQDWDPPVGAYSLVWIQWVLLYLTDDDAVAFLRRCGCSLVPGGYIVVKENSCLDEGFVLDSQDASVTRSVPYWRQLIDRAGLKVVYQQWETNFPDDIFPVPMFALQPL